MARVRVGAGASLPPLLTYVDLCVQVRAKTIV